MGWAGRQAVFQRRRRFQMISMSRVAENRLSKLAHTNLTPASVTVAMLFDWCPIGTVPDLMGPTCSLVPDAQLAARANVGNIKGNLRHYMKLEAPLCASWHATRFRTMSTSASRRRGPLAQIRPYRNFSDSVNFITCELFFHRSATSTRPFYVTLNTGH